MMTRRSTRDKAIAYCLTEREEIAIYGNMVTIFHYVIIKTHKASESHWWTVEDCYGILDQLVGRELRLWHVWQEGGEWFVRSWTGREITRTDCPAELVRLAKVRVMA